MILTTRAMFLAQSDVATLVAPVVAIVQPWQTLYSEHTVISTAVLFVHLAALVASGGLAVANDRAIVRTAATDVDERARRLSELSISHRSVLTALTISFASGVLLLLADLEAFVGMPAFWVKMLLILLLIGNARFMMRRETQLRNGTVAPAVTNAVVSSRLWMRLRRHALISLTLWFSIVLAGTAMTSS